MDEFRAVYLSEHRRDMRAAIAFEHACASGDPDAFLMAVDGLTYTLDAWRFAMLRIARLGNVSPAIRAAFLPVWIESKGAAATYRASANDGKGASRADGGQPAPESGSAVLPWRGLQRTPQAALWLLLVYG